MSDRAASESHRGGSGVCQGGTQEREVMAKIKRSVLLRNAYYNLGDGAGGEWDDNPEYTRGVLELVRDCLGFVSDESTLVRQAIRNSVRPSVGTRPYYTLLNEDGVEYDSFTDAEPALLMLARYPNDTIVVRLR